ncbi:E3 ubiquitin-protein ligase AIRP2-like isoform X2 [Amaranthus tricolor]|nr:E3 ubiquitin-protein ligase AIRP2-like isoform X2 [Amaranthus tricolor]XP_057542498.1 E3 ubiquitin-protein ligase AIRP2-like isoform X2 [Amaranthus tricolor]XP_057542499.1 E3 ubiquitin-protein ligase AIRP2-like isoform X2 [Amaranthus tricolor]
MRLSYSPLAPFLIYLIEWMDFSCTDALPNFLGLHHILVYKVYVDGMPTMSSQEKKASLREFYAVIYPSLKQLEGNLIELEEESKKSRSSDSLSIKKLDDKRKGVNKDLEIDDECGICMEPDTNIVLPTCGHALCIRCFHDWNARSRSCPFCRGSLKRVNSKDLWVLTNNHEIVDSITIARENLTRFRLYIESLPPAIPDTHTLVYDYMI